MSVPRRAAIVWAAAALVLAVPAVLWLMPSSRTVVDYPMGPIEAVTLPHGFRTRGGPDLPRSLIARSHEGLEFQILTVSTEAAGADNGPLSRAHKEMIEHPNPDYYQEDIEINGFAWSLELGSGPLSQILAVTFADGMTIGVVGTGDWSVEGALEVLEGIERREP